jgi:hypothetical protein
MRNICVQATMGDEAIVHGISRNARAIRCQWSSLFSTLLSVTLSERLHLACLQILSAIHNCRRTISYPPSWCLRSSGLVRFTVSVTVFAHQWEKEVIGGYECRACSNRASMGQVNHFGVIEL